MLIFLREDGLSQMIAYMT
jgi:hypothetical protein